MAPAGRTLSLALHDREPWLRMGLRAFVGRTGLAGTARKSSLLPRARTCPAGLSSPPVPFLSAVPSASMTRLARSRTASLTSASSVDGGRPQACTHSESSEGLGQVNHTMEVSC